MRGYAARVDANQEQIATALRQIGFCVLSLHRMGSGVPDLLISKAGLSALVEVKNPKGLNRHTEDQVEFAKMWTGKIFTARDLDDVERIGREW